MTKRCTKCRRRKPLDKFYRASEKKDGRKSACKECENEAQRRYRQSDEGQKVRRDYERRRFAPLPEGRSYVYVFRVEGTHRCKIGWTCRPPKYRRGNLKKLTGKNHVLECCVETVDGPLVEALAHYLLRRFRVPKSEMFEAPVTQCVGAVNWAQKYAEKSVLPKLERARYEI